MVIPIKPLPSRELVYSFSMLKAFETCPRQCLMVNLLKQVDANWGSSSEGKEFHKAMEQAIMHDEPRLSLRWKHYQWVHDHVRKVQSKMEKKEPIVTTQTEYQLAMNNAWNPVTFFTGAPKNYYRGVIDLLIMCDTIAYLGDYKHGNPSYAEPLQLQDQALLVFATFPTIDTIVGELLWSRHEGHRNTEKFKREDMEIYQDDLAIRINRVEKARAVGKEEAWVPKPSGLCAAHCKVPCRHNGQEEYRLDE